MTHAAQQWVDRLSGETLPVMRRTLTQVRDLLNQPSVNHRSLAQVISRDPGFSLHIIRQFNRLPRAPKEPVSRIGQAIPLLGMAHVEQASRALPCLEDRLQGPPRRGLIACYSKAAHAAIYVSALAQRRHDADEGDLYTAALLHDIGEMALWSQDPERMREVQSLLRQGDGYDDAALEIFGCTLREISGGLSEAWDLPELVRISQGLANSHLPRPLSVMLVSALARESSLGWRRPGTLDDLELLSEFLEIPLDEAIAWFHRQAAEAARQLQSLPIPLPAFQLIHNQETSAKPAPPPNSVETPARPAAPKGDPAPESPEPAAPAASPQPTAPPKPRTTPESAGNSVNPLQQRLTTALQELQREHGLQRAMFAMLNREKTELSARLVCEPPGEKSLKGFRLDLASPTLFSLLMTKPQAISLTPANAEKYRHMIPPSLHQVINPDQCLAMSVFLRNKPIGLFYADNGVKQAITPRQFTNFKAVCQRAIQALA